MANVSNLIHDLTCPLTLELFEDPVSVPCCGKAFSREPLAEHLSRKLTCPLCNGDLSQFDVAGAAKNVLLAGMVDTIQGRVPEVKLNDHRWSCTVTPITPLSVKAGKSAPTIPVKAEFKLSIEDAKFSVRPSLFIAVLDRSGSMGGRPAKQVSTALHHIESLARHNEQVKLIMLSYGSDYTEIHTASEYEINGGTNFRAAFSGIQDVLSRYMCSENPADANRPNNVSTVTIAFLTDGEDTCGNRDRLVPEFKEMLDTRWTGPLSVHAVGFGRSCDRTLLEGMRTAGSVEGIFRYAEPGDDDDTLCQKLTGIFEISSESSTVPIQLTLNGTTETVRFPINSRKYGEHKRWIDLISSEPVTVMVHSLLDQGIPVPVTVTDPTPVVFQRWLAHLTDQLAAEVLELSRQPTPSHNIRELYCALLLQKVEVIMCHCTEESVTDRLDYLEQQLEEFKIGKAVNVGKLSDLRYGSLFVAPQKSAPRSRVVNTYIPEEKKLLDDKPYNERPLKRYNRRNTDDDGRNELQRAIMDLPGDAWLEDMQQLVQGSTLEDVLHTDNNGNNALMLAAYCGHSQIVKGIVSTHPNLDLELENTDGETAVTLCIKKRGFHHTLGILLDAEAKIPRTKSMERYALENGFPITAQIISSYGDGSLDVDDTMKPEYIQFVFNRFEKVDTEQKEQKWLTETTQKFLDVALAKGMKDLVGTLLTELKAIPTIDMLVQHCIPKKPDSPDTPHYLELAELVLECRPELIHEVTELDQESALFVAAQKGSLPHVKYFLSRGAKISQPNHKGNTPLWIASFMRYPCIIDELLDQGADINRPNLKGNTPLYGPCTRGSVKVAEQLLSRGADVEHVNSNGDTLILLCCRNGQHEVLQFLLNYVDMEFANFKAHIDGFNAIMASAEQDRPECIRVLHEYGVDVNQRTDDDNAILASAAPLHIACYYARPKAVKMLLHVGADMNVQDKNGQTPLHISVIQGDVELIKVLRNAGADLMAKDSAGNVPMAYCRDRQEVRKVLVDPVLDVLMRLAKGGFGTDEKEACAILAKGVGVVGCLEAQKALDVQDYDGSTPLLQAVLHNKFILVETLVRLGSNPIISNAFGMNSLTWANWNRNRRIFSALGNHNYPTLTCLETKRLYEVAAAHPTHRQLLFLGSCPPMYHPAARSGVGERMEEFVNAPVHGPLDLPELKIKEADRMSVVSLRTEDAEQTEILAERIWDAKAFTINKTASGSPLDPRDTMVLALFTNNPTVSHLINTALLTKKLPPQIYQCAKTLYGALTALPPYTGEVFVGSSTARRKLYLKGQEFAWSHFASGSTLWRVALENVPSFTTKSRKGIVFIVKSKTGRYVGPYSQFSFDSEVVWLPGTLFRVTNWYHGDVIALGQENIREHTFGVKERDDERMELNRMIESDKSLIIEVCEI